MRYVIALLSLALSISCRTIVPPVKEVPIQYREKVVERLVPIVSPADSANVAALFECDSLNRVILKSLSEQKSKNGKTDFSFDGGLLRYTLKTSPGISYVPVKDSIVYREVPVKVPVEIKVNELTWWQKLWIGVGKVAGAAGLLAAVYFMLKSKFSIGGIISSLFR